MEVKTTLKFKKWFKFQKDKKVRLQIQSRFLNIELNDNFGDFKSLKRGLYELRFHINPGYRVYYSKKKGVVTILAGSVKSNQRKVIGRLRK